MENLNPECVSIKNIKKCHLSYKSLHDMVPSGVVHGLDQIEFGGNLKLDLHELG